MFLFLFLSSKAKAFQCYWNNALCHKESSMGSELDKPTESKSREILLRLKGAILELYSSSDWWPFKSEKRSELLHKM